MHSSSCSWDYSFCKALFCNGQLRCFEVVVPGFAMQGFSADGLSYHPGISHSRQGRYGTGLGCLPSSFPIMWFSPTTAWGGTVWHGVSIVGGQQAGVGFFQAHAFRFLSLTKFRNSQLYWSWVCLCQFLAQYYGLVAFCVIVGEVVSWFSCLLLEFTSIMEWCAGSWCWAERGCIRMRLSPAFLLEVAQ